MSDENPYTGEDTPAEPDAPWQREAWQRYDESPAGRETYRAAAEAVILYGVGVPPRGNEHLPPLIPAIREAEARASAAAANARAMGAGWCAPFTDGMWDLPTVSINVDTEAFQAHMVEARERLGDVAAGIAAAFDAVNNGLGPAFARLGRALSRVTYWTPDGPPPAPIVDAYTALIALNWAEWTEVVHHPDKATRRHAKARYLQIRRHLPRTHYRRLKSVPMNQFGALI